jgi:hypothetical protein
MRTAMVLLALVFSARALAAEHPPLALHPENPHYLLFRGKPTILITSAEHYGAVLNLDFDFVPYFAELRRHGLNLTRTFSGAYCEDQKSFNIKNNTLAPKTGRFLCPWLRSGTDGYAAGGAKFDLTQWDEAYFRRLKEFVAEAGKQGVVVELVLFCPFYEDSMWNLSPMKQTNNVNGIGDMPRTEVYTLKHPAILAVHEAMTKKIVEELRTFDNVYYEICNEPYFGGVTEEWQARIAAAIDAAQAGHSHKRLIAQNIANGAKKIDKPNPLVSIFNFHYATPPNAVAMNFHLNKVIGDDETGFKGSGDFTYRAEGWDFIIAGGGIYNNLDYSFTTEAEDGSATPNAPGGGGAKLRQQLATLTKFIGGFDFVKMSPDDSVIRTKLADKRTARALVEKGQQYAIYVRGDKVEALSIDLPAGQYEFQWLHPASGEQSPVEKLQHAGGEHRFTLPAYTEDLALGVKRKES